MRHPAAPFEISRPDGLPGKAKQRVAVWGWIREADAVCQIPLGDGVG